MGSPYHDPMKHLLSFALLFALACGDDDGGGDGGTPRDAGGNGDSAVTMDGGAAMDSGPTMDGGSADSGPATDSGSTDAGTPPDTSMSSGMCDDGPLDAPIPGCRPTEMASTGDLREDCVRRINQFRWDCQCLPPLMRWRDGEACADAHAAYDAERNAPHAGFRDGICMPGGRGQNECPGYPSEASITARCLQQMWDEGPGEPFSEHGHYINMTNPAHSMVACGFHTTDGGRVWAIQNFR